LSPLLVKLKLGRGVDNVAAAILRTLKKKVVGNANVNRDCCDLPAPVTKSGRGKPVIEPFAAKFHLRTFPGFWAMPALHSLSLV